MSSIIVPSRTLPWEFDTMRLNVNDLRLDAESDDGSSSFVVEELELLGNASSF